MSQKNINSDISEAKGWQYSLGNLGNNTIFMTVGTYVMFFYTNVAGISPLAAGTIFMVARLIDAFTDPLMGMIVDKTNTRFGRFRPYVMFGSPILGIIFTSLFVMPDFSMKGKITYAMITYIMYSLAWTVVQIPQLAVPSLLTNDVARRTRIQAQFQAFGSIASLIVTSFALPILDRLGGQEDPSAWFKLVAAFAVMAVISMNISINAVKDRDVYNPEFKAIKNKNKLSFKETFSVITKNKMLLSILVAFGTDMFAFQVANTLRIYFFRYNMGGRTDLISYIGMAGTIYSFVIVMFIQQMVSKWGKKKSIFWMEALGIVFMLPMLITGLQNKYSVALVMASYLLTGFSFAITNMLSRSAVLDSANYAEMKTGIKGTALVNSSFTFVNKVSQALSVWLGGYILQVVGYDANAAQQNSQTLMAILLICTVLPIIGYVCSLIALKFYPLTRGDEIELQKYMDEKLKNRETVDDIAI
ncbi:MFS transporter [Streptococcus moroccensis]|uniref:Sugar (Glycoside-pentoside-hexuronide) transporter n=1 Tax=Streptococcus moroccensis TaxID=1451356 RepID=A0ABT9YSJ0_9STRE|nr:glycoside-pentoside-hexuronide (GPH):cation symporter [Streptococcus moroccensis]MDQ0222592.1 sugar (glycoside-pentoside-hexuronide) transporter [Streptococcus moroccensis]